MDMLNDLEKMLSILQAEYTSVKKGLSRGIRGRLMISAEKDRTEFFAVSYKNGQRIRRSIAKDKDRIYRLANKAYLEQLALRLRTDSELLEYVIKRFQPLEFQSIARCLPANFELLDPHRIIDPNYVPKERSYPNPSRITAPVNARLDLDGLDPFEWAAMPYCENTKFLEYKTLPAANGLLCRSKSEALIIGVYDKLRIPYHYDEVILINNTPVSPDIIGARRDGALIFQEHRGLSTEGYTFKNDWKSRLYTSAGIILGKNLIYTYENEKGILNLKLAEEMIRDIYWL